MISDTSSSAKRRASAWRSLGQYWDSLEFRNAQVVPEDVYTPAGYERRLWNATAEYSPDFPSKDVLFPSEKLWPDLSTASQLADLQTNIATYITQAEAEFISGQRDISDDAAWAAYKKDIDGLGLSDYLKMQQKAYDAIK